MDLPMSVSWLWYCTVVCKMLQMGRSGERAQTISVLFLPTAYKSTIISIKI